MREEHPIDERFKALYDAEATPPEAVHEALAARMGWNGGASAATGWRPLLWAASALVVIGVGIGVWMAGNEAPTEQVVDVAHAVRSGSGTAASERATEATPIEPTRAMSDPSHSGASIVGEHSSAAPVDHSSVAESAHRTAVAKSRTAAASRTSLVGTPSPERVGAAVKRTGDSATAEGSSRVLSVDGGSRMQGTNTFQAEHQSGSPSANSPVEATTETAHDPHDPSADWIAAIPQPRIDMVAGTPIARAVKVDYVLPHGCWWIGAYGGMGTVSGRWRGDDATTLSGSETWRSTAQGGLLGGYEWRNGWSVYGGVGVARVRSAFRHETESAPQRITNVDTLWVENSMQDIPVYTWTIDSLVEVRPGSALRSDARNYYTAVQVPLNVAWHADARRLRYGAFCGVTAWVPTQRKGLTLVQTGSDAGFSTTSLTDVSVNERFGTQIHGLLGLSLGYSITEHFSAYAEPMISAPLFSFGGHDTPWLTRPLLQIRLQHALCSRSY